MKTRTTFIAVHCLVLWFFGSACDNTVKINVPDETSPANLSAPDGIDSDNPNIERSTKTIDFSEIRTIRVEVPNARLSLSQFDGGGSATLRVTEIVVKEGLSRDEMEVALAAASVSAEPSFVDKGRLDVRATVPAELTETEIIFDIRLVIPGPASLEAFLNNGPVDVTNLTGNVQIQTANGEIVIDDVQGAVIATTSGKKIEALDIVGDVSIQTSDADLTLRLTPPIEGIVSAVTSNGNIRMTIANTTAAELNLSAPGGLVTADVNGFNVSTITTGEGVFNALLNGGGGKVEATTTGGQIEFGGFAP